MAENYDRDAFTTWWRSVLERDEKAVGSPNVFARYLRCVICDRDLEKPLREALGAKPHDGGNVRDTRRSAAMFAWWADEDRMVLACGLYCLETEHACDQRAGTIGRLLDMHAESFTGHENAIYGLGEHVLHYAKWETTALRRMILLFTALSMLPASKAWERDPHL